MPPRPAPGRGPRPLPGRRRRRPPVLFLASALPGVAAFTCYPEYSFSWCDNSTEASCIHDYAFSVGHFQRKANDYYFQNRRPPLMEAYFLTKLPRPYQEQFLESGCQAPLLMAYLLVAEAKLAADDDAERYLSIAMGIADSLSDLVKPILQDSRIWPFNEAMASIERTQQAVVHARQNSAALLGGTRGVISLEFVVVHCREPLDWIEKDLLPITPTGALLTLYEKCGEPASFSQAVTSHFGWVQMLPCNDPEGGPRGDECLGYLAHLTNRYDELATFTVFMQADPADHMHFTYLQQVLKMIARGTYSVPFLSLNGGRHVRTLTPCLDAVHQAIFGEPMREPVGPYCCAQFVVQDVRIRARPIEFYRNMLQLVDGSLNYDLCFGGQVKRSTHCYGMEFTWHLVFGEDYDPPLRQDDTRLPMPLRTKWGDEHVRRDWNDVVLNPSTPKKIVEQMDYDKVIR